MSSRNHVLDGDKIGRIHLQPQGVTSRRCGLLRNYFGHLLFLLCLTVFEYENFKGLP